MANRPKAFGTQEKAKPGNIHTSKLAPHTNLSDEQLDQFAELIREAAAPLEKMIAECEENEALAKRLRLVEKNINDYLRQHKATTAKGFVEIAITFLESIEAEERLAANADQIEASKQMIDVLKPISREFKQHAHMVAPVATIY